MSVSFIEQQINLYQQSQYIITDDKYKEMRSNNDNQCLNLIRFHTNKTKGSLYMSTSHFQKLLVDTFNYHNQQQNHTTESYSLNIDDAGFMIYIDVDYDMLNVDINTATQINTIFSQCITQDILKMMST